MAKRVLSYKNLYRFSFAGLLAFILAFWVLVESPKPSHACGFCDPIIEAANDFIWLEAEDDFDMKLDEEWKNLQRFIVHDMWERSILPVMMLSAEQLTVFAMQQAMAIGMFIDAESQMDAQRLLQEIHAKAYKDYHPSVEMCEFGSLMKSIAATERKGELNTIVFSQRSQDRQLGQFETSSKYGHDLDYEGRIHMFRRIYCNEKNWGGALELSKGNSLVYACSEDLDWSTSGFSGGKQEWVDKDIDYFVTVDSPGTIPIDFTNIDIVDTSATPPIHNEGEAHLFEMSSNLFAHNTFPRSPARLLTNKPGEELNQMQKAYMDMRALVAKRSVAENSLYAITALKSQSNRVEPSGGGNTTPASSRLYMEHVLHDLGVPDTEIINMLGENPSYYAQMNILTKKLYQRPDFYTNLYDKPANVNRKGAAMQGIKLMQKFDMLKSALRSEASMSILLEMAVIDLQTEIEDQIQQIAGN